MTEKEEFQSFWDLLVPPEGKAETVQGEVIRIAGRIEYEFLLLRYLSVQLFSSR